MCGEKATPRGRPEGGTQAAGKGGGGFFFWKHDGGRRGFGAALTALGTLRGQS